MEDIEEKMKVMKVDSANPSQYQQVEKIGSPLESELKSFEISGFNMFMGWWKNQSKLQKCLSPSNMTKKDVSIMAKNEWKKLPPHEQRKWIKEAKDLVGDHLFNSAASDASLNIPDNMYRRLEPMTRDQVIQDCVRRVVFSGCEEKKLDFKLKSFAVVHFNVYTLCNIKGAIPAEYGVGSFSLQEGMSRCAGAILYPTIEDPACMSSVYDAKRKLGLPVPPIATAMKGDIDLNLLYPTRFHDGLKEILDAGQLWDLQRNSKTPVVLFILQEEDSLVEKCMEWLRKQCGIVLNVPGGHFELRTYPFTGLMRVLSQIGQEIYGGDSAIEFESEAKSFLMESSFNYMQDFACSWHQQEKCADYISMCSRNIAYRSCLLGRNAILKNYKNDDGSSAATEGIIKLGRRRE